MARLLIGTSGWNYKHWRGLFYPDSILVRSWLDHYAENFDTAEVNYSFYRLPKRETYEKWLLTVPRDFIFTLKCSRLITHTKRLSNLTDLWRNFLNNASVLGDQLGPILCQLPESFQADEVVLDAFLTSATEALEYDLDLRLALEFRHDSWFNARIYKTLEKHNAALVAADSSRFPRHDVVTADFAYYRYHGPKALFSSNYSEEQLRNEAAKMRKNIKNGLDVYGYFNNDGHGYAVRNALMLKTLLSGGISRKVS